jgi:hypothetical protein
MVGFITKRFTFTLILCLGMMQLLSPFLHAHYNNNVQGDAYLLHIHTIQIHSAAKSLSLDGNSDIHTEIVAQNLDSAIVDIGQGVTNEQHFDASAVAVVLIAIISFIVVCTWPHYRPLPSFKQSYSNRRPLSHAPPNA